MGGSLVMEGIDKKKVAASKRTEAKRIKKRAHNPVTNIIFFCLSETFINKKVLSCSNSHKKLIGIRHDNISI